MLIDGSAPGRCQRYAAAPCAPRRSRAPQRLLHEKVTFLEERHPGQGTELRRLVHRGVAAVSRASVWRSHPRSAEHHFNGGAASGAGVTLRQLPRIRAVHAAQAPRLSASNVECRAAAGRALIEIQQGGWSSSKKPVVIVALLLAGCTVALCSGVVRRRGWSRAGFRYPNRAHRRYLDPRGHRARRAGRLGCSRRQRRASYPANPIFSRQCLRRKLRTDHAKRKPRSRAATPSPPLSPSRRASPWPISRARSTTCSTSPAARPPP